MIGVSKEFWKKVLGWHIGEKCEVYMWEQWRKGIIINRQAGNGYSVVEVEFEDDEGELDRVWQMEDSSELRQRCSQV